MVASYAVAEPVPAGVLELGDVIAELDGVAVSRLIENWSPYYAASNESTRLRDIARAMTRGACGETTVRILRDGKELSVSARRLPLAELDLKTGVTHDLLGETFRRLSDERLPI